MNEKFSIVFGILIALLIGCASTPTPLEVSEVTAIEATVVAVDVSARTLVLLVPAGYVVGLNVGPEVRNLAQVEVGDTLRVNYHKGLLFSIAEPGQTGEDAVVTASSAEAGDRPGAMIDTTTSSTVEIISVASDGTSVSFRDASGALQSVDVPRKEGRTFARKLKKGDLVDVQYSESLAISVIPADAAN